MKFQLLIKTDLGVVEGAISKEYPKRQLIDGIEETFGYNAVDVRLIREELNITWKDVFNTSHHFWGSFENAKYQAYESGYPYFVFNGKVYSTKAVNTEHYDILEGDIT